MAQMAIFQKNQLAAIARRYTDSGLSWAPVLLFLPARFVFAFIAQGLTAGLFALSGAVQPWRAAAGWWPVYSTLTDVLCLLALAWLTRREGLSLLDLVGVKGMDLLKQLAWTPVYLLVVVPSAGLASLVTQLHYGSDLPVYIKMVDLPLAGVVYSLVVWPVIWVIAEELVYLGYLLPRLEALTGKTWLAVLITVFFWGLQHAAIPFLADGDYLFWRVLAAWVATSGPALAFVLMRRRLVPLMGVHYIADLSTAFMAGVLPLL